MSSPGRRRVQAARRALSYQLSSRRGLLETMTSKISITAIYAIYAAVVVVGRYNYLTANPLHLLLPRPRRGSKVQHAEAADLIDCLQKR